MTAYVPTHTYLPWLDDRAFFAAIQHVYDAYAVALSETDLVYLERNIIDPFTITFDPDCLSPKFILIFPFESYRQHKRSWHIEHHRKCFALMHSDLDRFSIACTAKLQRE